MDVITAFPAMFKRFHFMGLSGNYTIYCRFYGRADTEDCMDFLRHTNKEYIKSTDDVSWALSRFP